jgi:hypothetical protein
MELKSYFNRIMKTISIETETIDIDGGNITIEDAFRMIQSS